VAVRCWGEVERARAEAGVRVSERRQRFLLTLNDALEPLTTAAGIMSVGARHIGERLGVNRAFYAEIVGDDWLVGDGFEHDVAPLPPGTYPAAEYGRWTMDTLRGGAVVAVGDTQSDTRLAPAERAALASINVRAVLGVPLVRDGEIVAVLSTHSRTPHEWTDDEITLVRETAARTWPWVERARVQSELRETEAKYHSLFGSIDEGFCIIDIVDGADGSAADYRFVEVNRAFEVQTGLVDVTGKLGSEVDPSAERAWIDTYSDVARTGTAKRYTSRRQNTGRWYDIYASRVDSGGGRQVAIIIRDVTGCR
jgi:PAS domain-containing protein